MKLPVASQVLDHHGGNGDHAIPVAFGLSDPQFVLLAQDIVNGQGEAFGEPQSATIDELDGSAIPAQSDVSQQIVDLLAG